MKSNKISFVTVDSSLNNLNSKQLLEFYTKQCKKFNNKLQTKYDV